MRITAIEIANYRGFAGDSFRLALEEGENLLVYGENGAGKSSLYNSLKDFLYAATNKNVNIDQRRNRDNPGGAPAIRIKTTTDPLTEWTATNRGQDSNDWRILDDGKGFLDYRVLLKFYNAPKDHKGRLDLFRLLLEGMLAHHRMAITGTPTFLKEWRDIELTSRYYLHYSDRIALQNRVAAFNSAFKLAAEALAQEATVMLKKFDGDLAVSLVVAENADFDWYPKTLTEPCFVAEVPRAARASITDYDEFFNEARLSAIAICLFFAALKTCPIEGPRVLVLDDVLIGLDMANRRKVVNLVQESFADWQIIILTYHKAWFEVLKARVEVGTWGGHSWRSVVLKPAKCNKTGLVTIAHDESGTALETAELCLTRRDHKAAAVYARTALEAILHKHADRLHLAVQFKKNRLQLDTDDFLNPFEKKFEHLADTLKKTIANALVAELRFVRRTVLNAFAHADEISEDEIAGEVDHGIAVVRQFGEFFESLKKADFASEAIEAKPALLQMLKAARQLAAAGNYKGAGWALAEATHTFVTEYPEAIGLQMQYKRNPSFNHLFRAVFPEDVMDTAEKHAFRRLLPYFFGTFNPKEFDQSLFDESIRLIIYTAYGRLLNLLTRRGTGQVGPVPVRRHV